MEKEMIKLRVEGIEGRSGGGGDMWWEGGLVVPGALGCWMGADAWVTRQPTAVVRV